MDRVNDSQDFAGIHFVWSASNETPTSCFCGADEPAAQWFEGEQCRRMFGVQGNRVSLAIRSAKGVVSKAARDSVTGDWAARFAVISIGAVPALLLVA
jgi:hypothetical protein